MTTIEKSFIKQFEREVHEAYQRQGSKLKNTVRTKSGVTGATTVFQKVGKGAAIQKSRHGMVPVMSLDHEPVECDLADYYAGDWVDRLDELKTNIDERQAIANAGAYALGRKTDELKGGAVSAEALHSASQEMAKLKRVQAENQRAVLAAVNETIRAEMATEDAFVRRMRPTFGYILALSWLAQMGAVAYTIVAAPERAGPLIADIAELSAMWSVGLSVLGVYVYQCSREKGLASGASPVATLQRLAGKLAGDGSKG